MKSSNKIYLPDVVGGGYGDFWRCKARYRVLKGSKASKKSTTTALNHIYRLMKYPGSNLLVVRKIGDTHRTSTFAQLKWAIQKLGVSDYWRATTSPLELTYIPTGQKVLFRGFDDPLKLASTTVSTGSLCWVWVEEAYEIDNEDAFDLLDLSVPRGNVSPPLFKQTTLTFNPWSERHWLKKRFFDTPADNVVCYSTDYRCNEFLDAADLAIYERMRRENPRKYAVAGLGNWGVADGLVYDRWEVRDFDIDKARTIPLIRSAFGLDYGYTNDPTAFFCGLIHVPRRLLLVYDEFYERGMSNRDICDRVAEKGYGKERIVADSAEPKSNDELRFLGLRIQPAAKGRDSILNGIQYIQDYRIVIHPRCVHFASEISSYTWDKDKEGNQINKPIDDNNHLMDAMRYALEPYIRRRVTDPPPKKRIYQTGVTAGDMRGGWDV